LTRPFFACCASDSKRKKMRAVALISAFLAGASAEAVNLTPDNFDALVTQSGKSAFIKFLAPW